jgi:hypothetical protein
MTLYVLLGALLFLAGIFSPVYLSAFLQNVLQYVIFAIFTFGMALPFLRGRESQQAEFNRLIRWSFRGALVIIAGTVLMALNIPISEFDILGFSVYVGTPLFGYLIIIVAFLAWVRYYVKYFR